jgi:hypothetical protein
VPGARELLGLAKAGLVGQGAHHRADVLEMVDAGLAGRMPVAQLEQDVDEGAGLEVVAAEPLVEDVEDGE